MATFTGNQVQHLYVVLAGKKNTNNSGVAPTALTTVGDTTVGGNTTKKECYINELGPKGLLRSDIIKADNILSASSAKGNTMRSYLKKYEVAFNPTVLTSGVPVNGDYILQIFFKNYIGLSEENQYSIWGESKMVSGMTADDLYYELYQSLNKRLNSSVDIEKLLSVSLDGTVATSTHFSAVRPGTTWNSATITLNAGTSTGITAVTPTSLTLNVATGGTYADVAKVIALDPIASKYFKVLGTGAVTTGTPETLTGATAVKGIIFTELPQHWNRGLFRQEPVNFTILPKTVLVNGSEVIWGAVSSKTPDTFITNSRKTADLEWFCAGNRGDINRMMGFPNVVYTTYLIDPNSSTFDTDEYNYVNIHYYFAGNNEAVQKSEKDLTLVSKDATELNKIINSLNYYLGTSIATV